MNQGFIKRNLVSLGVLIMAIIVVILSFIAANEFVIGGTGIMEIQSVGGKTLEEAYYYQLGRIYNGYAFMCRSVGLGIGSIMMWLAINNLIHTERINKERECDFVEGGIESNE